MAREGRGTTDGDRLFLHQLLDAQGGDLAAPAAAGGEGEHQDSAVAQISEAARLAGRKQFGEDVAGDRLGALAAAGPRDGAHGKAYGGFEGRGGEGAGQTSPFGQCRPGGEPAAHRVWRMRAG